MKGYESFKLTRKQNNSLIPTRKVNLFQNVEAHYNDTGITLNYYASTLGKLISILTFPLIVIFGGLANIKEISKELYGIMFQKKTGNYSTDYVSSNTELYNKLEVIYLMQTKQILKTSLFIQFNSHK